jgi:excisionase family DNA binding protein
MIRRSEPEAEVLDLNEAAALLKVSDRTLWGLAREGEVPSRRVGKQYRFSRAVLLEWIQNNEQENQK